VRDKWEIKPWWQARPCCTPRNCSIGTFDRHTNITFCRSAHSRLPMHAVSTKATSSLGASPSTLPTVNRGLADLPITTTIPLLLPWQFIPPNLLAYSPPINNRLMLHSLPSIHVVKFHHQASRPVCSWSQATLPRKTLHADCLPLFHHSILSLVKLLNICSLARNCSDALRTCLVLV
jgi:hypothetical protein